MRILILHRIPNELIRYADGIDHLAHEVTYVGTAERMATLPPDLPCIRIQRPGVGDTAAEVLAAVADRPRPDLVVALSEYDLIAAARVREALGVPGDREDDVIPVRDKVVMKAAVERAGLRVPRFLPLPVALADAHSIPWTGPTVLKPLDGAASQDVCIFDSLGAALDSVRGDGLPAGADAAGFEIEEFVAGPIIHVDGVVVDGEPVAIQASRYVGTCLGYIDGQPVGSVQIDTTETIAEWALACLRAVGIRTGLFHLEGIETPAGPVFLEVGARFGGADIVDTFALARGVHMPSSQLRAWTDGRDSRLAVRTPDSDALYGWFVWPGHHLGDEHCRIRGAEPFRDSPLAWRWVQRKDREPITTSLSFAYSDVPLAGIVGPAPSSVLEKFLGELFDTVRVEAGSAMEACHD